MRASPCWIASDGSEGVEGSLKRLRRPSCSKTKSVNVPPVSTPTRVDLELCALFLVLCSLFLMVTVFPNAYKVQRTKHKAQTLTQQPDAFEARIASSTS